MRARARVSVYMACRCSEIVHKAATPYTDGSYNHYTTVYIRYIHRYSIFAAAIQLYQLCIQFKPPIPLRRESGLSRRRGAAGEPVAVCPLWPAPAHPNRSAPARSTSAATAAAAAAGFPSFPQRGVFRCFPIFSSTCSIRLEGFGYRAGLLRVCVFWPKSGEGWGKTRFFGFAHAGTVCFVIILP
jgi:hypothetical protein